MLNNAVRASRADHIVFIDGDCIPARHFLLDHWNEREEGKVLLGRRVEMSERWSRALTVEKIRSGEFERMGWAEMIDGLKGRSLRVEDGIRIPSACSGGSCCARSAACLEAIFRWQRRTLWLSTVSTNSTTAPDAVRTLTCSTGYPSWHHGQIVAQPCRAVSCVSSPHAGFRSLLGQVRDGETEQQSPVRGRAFEGGMTGAGMESAHSELSWYRYGNDRSSSLSPRRGLLRLQVHQKDAAPNGCATI